MLAAILASMLDSVGDYMAYARTLGEPLPPQHAVNRGIAMEGIATAISGMIHSVGDYMAYARALGEPLPPQHAVNRGIAMEGIATFVNLNTLKYQVLLFVEILPVSLISCYINLGHLALLFEIQR